MLRYLLGLLAVALGPGGVAFAAALDGQKVDDFIAQMAAEHAYDTAQLHDIFAQATRADSILEAISKPAESKPWYKYRPIFLTEQRISAGVEFWRANEPPLARAAAKYGVPPELIVAIIGVETFYGRNVGRYRVVDALGTLAFHYPKRAAFFRDELVQYLLLTREERIAPLSLVGSYAGAMGLPQFISSSFRRYAVDFNEDGKRDIWNDPVDAIGSVANYFTAHGWQCGRPVITRVDRDDVAAGLVSEELMPRRALGEFMALGLTPSEDVAAPGEPAMLLELEGEQANQYWFGFTNFYVITRYNHSAKYAMAVVQLAESIRNERARAAGSN